MSNGLSTTEMKRGVEALRSGVPSTAAVKTVGSGQELLSDRFRTLLNQADREAANGRQSKGMLFRAGFGEGKSHLLTAFEHMALENSYAVSRLVISKETPLYVPAKLLVSAVENLRVPGAISPWTGRSGRTAPKTLPDRRIYRACAKPGRESAQPPALR